ncbi:unnamed protein product [Rotaria sp. Silwood2]|nr:unnamed protein product [Rotaria sp. Silwood2]
MVGYKRKGFDYSLKITYFQGFRHDYLREHYLPTLNRFRNEGVRAAHGMQPVFTTLTYPNHISIATGMYPEEHGIVHNSFYDRLLKLTIGLDNRDDGQWSDPKVEPIWITATKQKVKSAVLFWPACHNEFYGVRPLIYSWLYTDNVSFREKIDNAIGYFRELPVQFVIEPDKQGHTYGPDSPEVHNTLLRLDFDIEYLLDKTKKELNDDLNIIILSDHVYFKGMTNVTGVIRPFFEKYLSPTSVETNLLSGALFNVMPKRGLTRKVYNNLSNLPNVTVYRRDELPERFHYSKLEHRLGEITVLPNSEGQIISRATTKKVYNKKGNHGWDNTLATMQAIFMARGPSFNKNVSIDSLNNVDIYHIACHILKLNPNPHATAGSIVYLTSIFRTIENMTASSTSTSISSTIATFTTTMNDASCLYSIYVLTEKKFFIISLYRVLHSTVLRVLIQMINLINNVLFRKAHYLNILI